MLVVIVSPGCRKVPVITPTPDGVPVKIRSPGSSVQIEEMYETNFGMPKIRSSVRAYWRLSPFTSQVSARLLGLSSWSADTTQGPIGP